MVGNAMNARPIPLVGNLAHLGASSLSHEAQSSEHTDTGKKLKTGVRETNHSTGTGQVSLRLQEEE